MSEASLVTRWKMSFAGADLACLRDLQDASAPSPAVLDGMP